LVTNALKYAFPKNRKGVINVTFKTTGEDRVVLIVADNGVGLPAGFDIDASDALGMQIINALVNQLHGTLQISKKGGTTFTIEFQASLK